MMELFISTVVSKSNDIFTDILCQKFSDIFSEIVALKRGWKGIEY
jgi:hypothetical protein